MLRDVTRRDGVQPMPEELGGTTYYSTSEVLEAIGVSRQTLWRWRQDPEFPQGGRLRGRLLFTEADLEQIREYAFDVEPVEHGSDPSQLALFRSAARG